MSTKVIYLIGIFLSALISLAGQDISSSSLNAVCSPVKDVGVGHPQTTPVIFGKAFVTPNVRVHFLDAGTKNQIGGNLVVVHYTWWYFNPTSGENCEWGCWEDAYENAQCITDKSGTVNLPEFEVVPSGWFKTKPRLFFSTAPKFHDIEIDIHTQKWIIGYHLSQKELERMRKTQTVDVTFEVEL